MATVTIYTTVSTPSGHRLVYAGVTGGSAYAAGGEALAAANFGLNALTSMYPSMANGYVPEWDNGAQKIKYRVLTNAATNNLPMMELNGTHNMALITFPVVVIGLPNT